MREPAPDIAHHGPTDGVIGRGECRAEVDLLPSVDFLLGTNALQERFAPHTSPSVSPGFPPPRLLPAPREPET